MWVHEKKEEESPSSLGEHKPNFLGFLSKGLGKEKNKRESCFFSIFLSPLHLLQMSIFNLWRGSRDLKKGSRSAKKMVFMQASTLEKTNQIKTSSGPFKKAKHMYDYVQPVRIIFIMSLSSGDH